MRRAAARASAWAVVMTLGLAACSAPLPVPQPEPLPAVAPSALGDSQVSRILGEVTTALAAADASHSADALGDRISSTAKEIRAAQYVQAAAGATDALTEIPATPQTVIAPVTTSWPRTLMVVTTAPEDLRAPLLLTLVQESPRARYTLTSWVRLFPGIQMPATAQPSIGSSPVEAESQEVATSPAAVLAQYVDALGKGSDSEFDEMFSADPLRDRIGQQRAGWTAAVGAQGSVAETYEILGSGPTSLATVEGGAIVVGTVRTITTISLVDSTLTIGDQTAALLGASTVSSSLVISWDSVIAFSVPPAGSTDPIVVLGAEHAPVSVTGS